MPAINPGLSLPCSQLVMSCMRTPQGSSVPMFAVVSCGPNQYKITTGDIFPVSSLRATIGSLITLKKVLLVGGPKFTAVGRPLLENARVLCEVEENKAMRNTVFVRMPKGKRLVCWKDQAPLATVLRVRAIEYDPVVVGELDKYRGTLLDPSEEQGPVAAADGQRKKAREEGKLSKAEILKPFQSAFDQETAQFFEQFAPRRK